jgi:hypothetical protein
MTLGLYRKNNATAYEGLRSSVGFASAFRSPLRGRRGSTLRVGTLRIVKFEFLRARRALFRHSARSLYKFNEHDAIMVE